MTHVKPLLQSMNASNIYQLNIFKILLFMHKVKNNQTLNIFNNIFSNLENKYNTRLCEHNFTKPLYNTKLARYTIPF